MESWMQDIEFERVGPVRKIMRKLVVNPLVNYLPAGFTKFILRHFKSELAAANWEDPGGWLWVQPDTANGTRRCPRMPLLDGGECNAQASGMQRGFSSAISIRILVTRCPLTGERRERLFRRYSKRLGGRGGRLGAGVKWIPVSISRLPADSPSAPSFNWGRTGKTPQTQPASAGLLDSGF